MMTFGWLFWLVVGFLIWRLVASRGCGAGRRGRERRASPRKATDDAALEISRDLEDQRSYVEALETRVAELEERLDFTERLLASRRDSLPEERRAG